MAFRTNKTPVLQTKSASGSVATFNTALAMPLSSCIVDFEDETGIDSLDFTTTGKNLCPPVIIEKDTASSVKFPIDKDKTYVFTKNCNVNTMIFAWDAQDNFVGRTVGANTSTRVITKESFSSGGGTKDFDSIAKIAVRFYQSSGQNIDDVTDAEYQIEVGDTATPYEPFGDTKLFSFGKTVQNGSLNVLTGELTNNDTTPPEVINLGGMEIDTLQGVNNIWADTGDIDLTYKDLDIAKRGNFREVFKLPS